MTARMNIESQEDLIRLLCPIVAELGDKMHPGSYFPVLKDSVDLKQAPVDPELLLSESIQVCLGSTEQLYRKFILKKKSGGNRQMEAPKQPLKSIQYTLHELFAHAYSPLDCVHGFVRGRSTGTNALSHVAPGVLINVDLKSFFHSITADMLVEALVADYAVHVDVAKVIADLCTLNGRLPMGAPTSPILSNMVFERCDIAIHSVMEGSSVTYTRYADDLSFSASNIPSPEKLVEVVGHVVESHGFALNPKKTRVQRPYQQQRVTGLVVNENLNVPRKYKRVTRAMRHRCKIETAAHGEEMGLKRAVARHNAMHGLDWSIETYLAVLEGREAYEYGINNMI